jgi:hypothetical protein
MAKLPESKNRDIEFHPDAMERFERAAGVVAKAPPQHRVKPPKAAKRTKAKKAPRGR